MAVCTMFQRGVQVHDSRSIYHPAMTYKPFIPTEEMRGLELVKDIGINLVEKYWHVVYGMCKGRPVPQLKHKERDSQSILYGSIYSMGHHGLVSDI